MPETRDVSDGVECIYVNLDGEGHHEREQVKNLEGKVTRHEKKAKKFKARREKLIRIESEETQDHAREAKDTDQEEAEELSFVSSAISVPRSQCFVVTISAAKRPSASGSWRRW